MTEQHIQNMLYRYFVKPGEIGIPNNCVFGWEADLVVIRKSFFTVEIEIKISVADFRNDAGKEEKHALIRDGFFIRPPTTWRGEKRIERRGANYFFYAVPEALQEKITVPDHAGLIIICDTYAKIVKRSKKLHDGKLSQQDLWQVTNSIHAKYWKVREQIQEMKLLQQIRSKGA